MGGLKEFVRHAEKVMASMVMHSRLAEHIPLGRAAVTVVHKAPKDRILLCSQDFDMAMQSPAKLQGLIAKGALVSDREIWMPDPNSYAMVGEAETVWNQITNSGRDFLHEQGYQGTGAGQGSYTATNGLNYIALTNTAVTPAAGDTTLSGEIATNGLSRAQGTVTHSGGTNTTAIDHTFTCATAPQACQASALFNLTSSGIMNHELTFTQRSLQIGDTIDITYTITLG